MGVNADINNIEKQIQVLKDSLNRVGVLYKKLKNGYQDLQNWNDSKAQEAKEILASCGRDIAKMERALTQTVSALEKMIKPLIEYENTNLYAGGGHSANRSDSADASAGGTYSAYTQNELLGVSVNGTFSQQYTEILRDRYESADPLARHVFDTYKDTLCVQNANYPPDQTPHYCPLNDSDHQRGVYYNTNFDENNARGNGTTYFHELGHMIDHAATGYEGNVSNTAEFRAALLGDGQNVLDMYDRLPQERQQDFLRRIYQGDAHSFSDLIDATTEGRLHGAYGHGRAYWNHDGNLQAEAFAHFFEASMGCEEKREFLAAFFPNAFGIFTGILENIVEDHRELVLRLVR